MCPVYQLCHYAYNLERDSPGSRSPYSYPECQLWIPSIPIMIEILDRIGHNLGCNNRDKSRTHHRPVLDTYSAGYTYTGYESTYQNLTGVGADTEP
jgi:hypothetical protein